VTFKDSIVAIYSDTPRDALASVSVVSQCKLLAGWGLKSRDQHRPICGSRKTSLYSLCHVYVYVLSVLSQCECNGVK